MTTPERYEKPGESLRAGVARVDLRDFRNYAGAEIDLDEGLNLIAGPNAQGKTNLLESLYLLSSTRLLRGQKDSEAIREGAHTAHVSADLIGTTTQLAIILEAGIRKRATLNGMRLPRASDLIGRLPCVCISSLDLEIVREEPSARRLFLDLELSALYPAYLRNLAVYKRAVEHRNALLRDSRDMMRPPESFEPWEQQIANSGAELRHARMEYVAELTVLAASHHARMGGGETLHLEYAPKDDAKSGAELQVALERSRPHDVMRGGTGVGPHRDDLTIRVSGRDARLFGSQGQQRTAVIALKLGTLDLGRRKLGAWPMLLLDDMLSDLDERRRSALVEVVLGHGGQTVLTCTEASAAGHNILDRARIFAVSAGQISIM